MFIAPITLVVLAMDSAIFILLAMVVVLLFTELICPLMPKTRYC